MDADRGIDSSATCHFRILDQLCDADAYNDDDEISTMSAAPATRGIWLCPRKFRLSLAQRGLTATQRLTPRVIAFLGTQFNNARDSEPW
jgi:hypothetical protein